MLEILTGDILRILHLPENIAGQASYISRGQRAFGVQSDVLIYYHNMFEYECDYDLNLVEKSMPLAYMIILKNFLRCIRRYEVFHFHFGKTFLPLHLDLWILRMLGKKTVMHYWGSDVIQYERLLNVTRLNREDVQDRINACNDEKKRKHISWLNHHVDLSIVGDYSLMPYSPESIVVRQAIDVSKIPFVGSEWKGGPVRVVHAPSKRSVKGTKYILEALDRLKKEGYALEILLVENMKNEEALQIYKSADIVVDDVVVGPYGILAMECMAMGKSVLAFIHESFIQNYQDLPILNTSPDNIYENLKMLILDPTQRAERGRKGREYVEKNHDNKVVARHILDIYEDL